MSHSTFSAIILVIHLGLPKSYRFVRLYISKSNGVKAFIKSNVMATLGPGWQMMDSSGFWWTNVNEIRNLSSFWPGGLNSGIKS